MAEAADILVFAPHPDDAELCCGGLLLRAQKAKMRVGIVDITRGEMGTRGSIASRKRETANASRFLGVIARENLGLPDGHLSDDKILRAGLVKMLRKYRPSLLLAPHWEDQHPDHAAVGQASLYAAFLAGVPRFDAASGSGVGASDRLPYRPQQILHYNNRYGIQADIILDISDVLEQKLELMRCYKTQFGPGSENGKKSKMHQTKLSHDGFFDWVRSMHSFYGFQCGFRYGEPYCCKGPFGATDLNLLMRGRP